MPVRIQRKRSAGWKMPPNTVYVGRPTEFGNPWATGDRARDVQLFREWWIDAKHSDMPPPYYRIHELHGKNLACWCPPDQPCHADVLLEIAKDYPV